MREYTDGGMGTCFKVFKNVLTKAILNCTISENVGLKAFQQLPFIAKKIVFISYISNDMFPKEIDYFMNGSHVHGIFIKNSYFKNNLWNFII